MQYPEAYHSESKINMGQQTENAAPHCWFFLPWWQSMFVTFQQLWRTELCASLHCCLISPVSWVTSSLSCLFTLKISKADAFLRVAMAVKYRCCETNLVVSETPSALKADATRYNYAVETILPSVCDVPATQPCVGFSWNSFFTKRRAIVSPKNISLVTTIL